LARRYYPSAIYIPTTPHVTLEDRVPVRIVFN
jgi:hypothetical protein